MNDKHLENWQALKESMIQACPVKVKGYAIVAIGEDDQTYWGANYGNGSASTMLHWLTVITKDVKEYLKR